MLMSPKQGSGDRVARDTAHGVTGITREYLLKQVKLADWHRQQAHAAVSDTVLQLGP